MSKQLPTKGTTVILRQRTNDDPMTTRDFNNQKPAFTERFCVVLRESGSNVVVQLKVHPVEAYIPARFFLSKGSDLNAKPPIISIPATFEIQTLPI